MCCRPIRPMRSSCAFTRATISRACCRRRLRRTRTSPCEGYYGSPAWPQHLIAWVNLHSKFGCYSQRALLSVRVQQLPSKSPAPKNWWADPVVAARSARGSGRAAIAVDHHGDREECRGRRTKLCILVVGPVANYAAVKGESPLAAYLPSWGLDIPVIDVAIKARALADRNTLTFPIDGHLTERGHEYLACEAAPALQALLLTGLGPPATA